MKDLDAPPSTDGRIRRPGAGRKRLLELDPELEAALDVLIDPDVRDDPRVAPALDLQERIGPRDRHPRSAPISELDPRFATWGLESRLPLQWLFMAACHQSPRRGSRRFRSASGRFDHLTRC